MASQERAAPTGRPGGADDVRSHTDAENDPASSAAPEDFEFCILSSGGLALAGEDAAEMCVADEVFSGGKLLPLRLSSATSADALLRSDSLTTASTSGFSSRSVSRSASSSSSSGCVSRSTSSKSASSDPAGLGSCPPSSKGATADAAVPPRRLPSSSVFYAHPSPSPRPPRRSARPAAGAAPRRSTGSAPPASWGVIRLGVVGAPEVYAPRPAENRKAAAASARGGSRSARFDQPPIRAATKEDKKLALGLLGAGLVCSCSPDAVAPVGSAEVAAAQARRGRKIAEEKKRAAKQIGQSTARRSRILEWLEELSISKEKSVVV
ncbi:zinc finger CCCH domain-containing protein 18-like [Panicum miliaceum]|uniref:Zinc finger CCCH domain-containing protein 18-like n=1 Tax=Panicum miliaceum TaxID=4540 RepID=A0A3L6TLK2_PANMI|nr:zinc finger CCCH domain-containing protein 18-like [Panicum miliaceum]